MEDRPFYPSTRGKTQITSLRIGVRHRMASRRREPTYHIQQGLNNLTLRHMSTLFCEAIMNTPKEPKVKTPTIEAYNGTSVPDIHLVAYRHHMYVQGTNEATWFMAYKEERNTSMHLGRIQHGKDESLQSYVKRFNMEAGQILDLPDDVSFNNFIRGLKKGSVSKDGKAGEATESSGKKERTDRKITRVNGTWALSKEEDPTSTGQKRGRPQEKEFFEYNMDLLTILVDVGTRFDVERPFPMKSPAESRDPKLYCQFYEDIGHDTKDSRSLKRALDGLASKGHLKCYLQRNTHGTGKSHYKKNKSPISTGEGNQTEGGFTAIISGGSASGGPTTRGQKDYARRLGQVMLSGKSPMDPFPRIEICESNGGRIATPHDDPLVIEIKIFNMRVKRILVDTGSSSDIMSMECLSRLAHDPKTIESIHYPIIGFGGSIIHPVGVITLHIKAVVVTHLMLLKYVCDDGSKGTIHGDQQQAGDCYLTTLNPSTWRKEPDGTGVKRKHEESPPTPKEGISVKLKKVARSQPTQ
ncbi:uncharacterized protein [Spinacia oleracea]|uniref:Retrotransposon gag domain-containing protein n=1 Tax=Spinacia oleracea TaxID=3562 RepID=A0A9R0HRE2_SPIOL|nr:uncharacterized protein LOC110775297 [Spinacia oleracea]